MGHYPVNHQLRPFYRFLAALTGIYVLGFGVISVVRTAGGGLFDRSDVTVLGLRTNLAFAIASVAVGAALLVAVAIGRNVDTLVSLAGGVVFMAAGTVMMAVLRTDLNLLNSTMITVIVSFAIGLLLFTAGLYIRSGDVRAEEH
jgi:hypothetical protein